MQSVSIHQRRVNQGAKQWPVVVALVRRLGQQYAKQVLGWVDKNVVPPIPPQP